MSEDAPASGHRARWSSVVYSLILLSPGILPLVCSYLPFQDWAAHVGVVGGMLHLDDPTARILEFHEYTPGLRMNSLFYWPAYGLAQVLPPLLAVNLTFAATLAAFGPSVAFFCRSVGAPGRAAIFAVPLAMGRHVYCGFAPNALALALFFVALGLAFRTLDRPRMSHVLAFSLVLGLLALCHGFIFLAAWGLLLLVLLASGRRPRPSAGLALGLLASLGLRVERRRRERAVRDPHSGEGRPPGRAPPDLLGLALRELSLLADR